jgi:hypothetical protein
MNNFNSLIKFMHRRIYSYGTNAPRTSLKKQYCLLKIKQMLVFFLMYHSGI